MIKFLKSYLISRNELKKVMETEREIGYRLGFSANDKLLKITHEHIERLDIQINNLETIITNQRLVIRELTKKLGGENDMVDQSGGSVEEVLAKDNNINRTYHSLDHIVFEELKDPEDEGDSKAFPNEREDQQEA